MVQLPKHLPALDGLRGVAILLVMLAHAGSGWKAALSGFQAIDGLPPTFAVPVWVMTITDAGVNGVTLFFVISAFTLTLRAQVDTGGLATYALRRVARIGPGFWMAILLYAVAGRFMPVYAERVHAADIAIAAFFGGVWQGGSALVVVPGGWSISEEAAFYVALPLLLRLIDGRLMRALLLTGIALMTAHYRATAMNAAGAWTYVAYTHPLSQAPVFLCGITAAMLASQVRLPRSAALPLVLLTLAVVVLPMVQSGTGYLLFAIMAATAAAISAAAPPWLLTNRAIRRLGEVSYSLYLVHFALLGISLRVALWLIPAADWRTMLLHLAITCVAGFAVARVTYRWIERPAIEWAARRVAGKTAAGRIMSAPSSTPR